MWSPQLPYRNTGAQSTKVGPIFKETYGQKSPNLQRLKMRTEPFLFLKITLQEKGTLGVY